jgi:hypothetical protein
MVRPYSSDIAVDVQQIHRVVEPKDQLATQEVRLDMTVEGRQSPRSVGQQEHMTTQRRRRSGQSRFRPPMKCWNGAQRQHSQVRLLES